jgi:hypothetical protein
VDWIKNYIRDYLVDTFLGVFKASRRSAKVVKALVAFDALTVIQILLAKFGMAKFIEVVFWVGLFI